MDFLCYSTKKPGYCTWYPKVVPPREENLPHMMMTHAAAVLLVGALALGGDASPVALGSGHGRVLAQLNRAGRFNAMPCSAPGGAKKKMGGKGGFGSKPSGGGGGGGGGAKGGGSKGGGSKGGGSRGAGAKGGPPKGKAGAPKGPPKCDDRPPKEVKSPTRHFSPHATPAFSPIHGRLLGLNRRLFPPFRAPQRTKRWQCTSWTL